MTDQNEIRSLKRRIEYLERQLRRIPKPHDTQGKEFDLIKRDPADIKAGDLGNTRMQCYKDTRNNKGGLVFRIDGELFKLEATKL